MSDESISYANQKMSYIYNFFDRNKTVFTLIAIFAALAGFLYSFDKTGSDENLVFGVLFLVFMIGFLMLLIFYDVGISVIELINIKEKNFFISFQLFFIGTFSIFLLMFYDSLIEFLYSKYTVWVTWSIIVLFVYILWAFRSWVILNILKKIGNSTVNFVIAILCHIAIIVLILLQLLSFIESRFPNPTGPMAIVDAQYFFVIMVVFIFITRNFLYLVSAFIKKIGVGLRSA